MSVEVKTAPKFEATVPKALFQTRILGAAPQAAHYSDVAPDGRRFLINSYLTGPGCANMLLRRPRHEVVREKQPHAALPEATGAG